VAEFGARHAGGIITKTLYARMPRTETGQIPAADRSPGVRSGDTRANSPVTINTRGKVSEMQKKVVNSHEGEHFASRR
jgi:hypothetical protein